MKSRRTSLGTSKKTTVMANTIKQDRTLVTGNRRRSSNQYVVELRMNNAKLATSLANERNKNSKIIQLNTSMREQIVGQQAELRAIAGAARAGLQKFQSALDLMIEASDLIVAVNQKIGILCPELAPVQQQSNLLARSSQSPVTVAPTTRTSSSPVGRSTSSVLSRNHKDSSGTSTLMQGTARPMVQGQVISTNPTVPLQRLIVPVPLGRGPQRVPPERGVDFNVLSSRLSDISEQSNESSGGDALSPRSCAPPQSISPSNQPMPESHVLLERLLPASSKSSADKSLAEDDDEQLTVVHFGSFSFNEASCIHPGFSPSKQSPVISESIRALPCLSPQRSAEHSSSMYDMTEAEESSSEDENVALQIVESKKSYLERQRQEDCKEGTSWNYDEAGKFHKRPPRKRRSKRSKSPASLSHEDAVISSNSGKTADQLNESAVTRSLGTIETPRESVEGACVHLEKSDPLDISDVTSHDAIDMSFTCLTSKQQKNLLLKNLVNNQESNDDIPESLDNSFNEDDGGRKVFVTQRPRRKRSASDNHLSPRIGSLSPLNINKNITASDIENNENSPPTLSQRSVTYDKIFSHHNEVIPANHQEISPRASFVVLERLPNNIISGNIIPPTPMNCTDSVILKRKKKCTATDKASKLIEASCASQSNLENKHAISPISPNRKRSLSETQISPGCTGSIDAQFDRNNRPGPKQSKQRKKKRDNEISEESAPTSPASSRNGDTSECESVDLEGSRPRPRRNAAPINLKEPKLTTKMRRQ